MNKDRKIRTLVAIGLALASLTYPLRADPGFLQDEVSSAKEAPESPEIIIPGPKDVKEGTGIALFLAWIWLSVLVLVSFLRLKIREADRLYSLRYFKDSDQPPAS